MALQLSVRFSPEFERDYVKLPPELRAAAKACVEDLERDPIPSSRRPHSVTPRGHRPVIYTVDVLSNKSYKLSYHVEGRVAVLRRVGTHKQIDRRP